MSGSPNSLRIASRARSRNSEAATSELSAAAVTGGRISTTIRPGCGYAPLGDSATRVPLMVAGTTGHPARAAVKNAPV